MQELDGRAAGASRSEPVPEQELKNAKRALIGRFALSLDSPQTLIGQSRNAEDLRAAGRLLGHVSAARRGDHRRRHAARREEVLRPRAGCRSSPSATAQRCARCWRNTARSRHRASRRRHNESGSRRATKNNMSSNESSPGPCVFLRTAAGRLAPIEPREAPAVVAAFFLFFFMWAGYFAVRPVRETIGTIIGREKLADVWLDHLGRVAADHSVVRRDRGARASQRVPAA